MDIPSDWKQQLNEYTARDEFKKLQAFIDTERAAHTIFPSPENMFRAFTDTPFGKVRVVIIGQDPYHKTGQAHGLSFSVPQGVAIPPSLVNIFKEIERDTGKQSIALPDGDLTVWAHQGVLLLNSVLTVREGQPASHANKRWEDFTDFVIQKISQEKEHVVFLLWGAYAQKKGRYLDRSKHLVLEASHPSPLGVYRGFSGCCHFSQTNTYLAAKNKPPIEW